MSSSVEIIKNVPQKPKDEFPEEDKSLYDELEMLVERLNSTDDNICKQTLETLGYLIQTATTSMTSVPKPLKYLRQHYNSIKENYKRIKNPEIRKQYADIISVLALTTAGTPEAIKNRDCLHFCLAGTMKHVGDWGHEYVRQLENEVAEQWIEYPSEEDRLLPLVCDIIKFDTKHHADVQACDLLMEIDRLDLLHKHLTNDNYTRVCLYLIGCANYVGEFEAVKFLRDVVQYYLEFKEYPRALAVAMKLNESSLINQVFSACSEPIVRKQLAYMLGHHRINVALKDDVNDKDDLQIIVSNCHLNENFHNLGRELDIMEPKSPEEIFKTWLEPIVLRPSLLADSTFDSARQNLASTFVNAFVNAGFGSDKLLTVDGNKWIYKNKEHGMLSATASLGLIHLWDVDGGLTPIDKYLYTNDNYVKAGALLALGIVNCGVRNECDPALALLSDYVLSTNQTLRAGAILGLGLAYAGTCREDVLAVIAPAISCNKSTDEVVGLACVALGLIAIGRCHSKATEPIIQYIVDMKEKNISVINSHMMFVFLGLGLSYLGQRESDDVIDATLNVLPEPLCSLAHTMLTMCTYAGSGDVLIIQELLYTCCEVNFAELQENKNVEENKAPPGTEKKSLTVLYNKDSNRKIPERPKSPSGKSNLKSKPQTETKSDSKNKTDARVTFSESENDGDMDKCDMSVVQSLAALAVACIAMGEEIGSEMCQRILGHLARYGEPGVRKAVPLAVALCSVSNPQPVVIDVLSKHSHDSDLFVACNAIFSLGIVGAGTNNARLAAMLRQLAVYHQRNPNHLFAVRLAQGLTYASKGTVSFSPFHSETQIMNPVAIGCLLVTFVAMLDCKNTILGKNHYLLYTLAGAMNPRWLVTLDENLEQISVPVRIGQAVDVIGKAGTPKTISGIRTHSTPVLLAVGEKAELATEEYQAVSPIMDGFVILCKKEMETD